LALPLNFKPVSIQMIKKFIGTIWRCVANVYWGTMAVFNLPIFLMDIAVRVKTSTVEDILRTIQMLQQDLRDSVKVGI
jgi:hypothetical protein